MWYVYDKKTTVIQKTLKTAPAAKAWITRQHREHLANSIAYHDGPLFQFGYAEAQEFHQHIEKSETKQNLMTGKSFTQPVNTPRSCDPSSELYWTM